MRQILSNFKHSTLQPKEQISEKKTQKKGKTGNILDFMQDSEEITYQTPLPPKIIPQDSMEELPVNKSPIGPFLIIDTRETQSAVVRELTVRGMEVVLKALPVGDYVVSERIGVERKTEQDFIDSLKDGRLFNELHALSQNFAIPILLLEGNPLHHTSITKSAISGALASIIVNMRVSILYTDSPTDTADLLIALVKKVHQDKNLLGKVYKKKTTSEAEAQEQIISGIPGINIYRAQELLTAFANIENIFNAAEEDLEQVPGIGKQTAKKIREIAEYNYNKEKR